MSDKFSPLRFIRIIAVILSIILVVVLLLETLRGDKELAQNESSPIQVEGIAGMQLGGDFTLTRHDGVTVTHKDLEGVAHLIFFGFTYCPDICPTELATMTRMLNKMTQSERDKLRVVFVSVDPERDTVEQMKSYMDLFHDQIEGLTGTQEQIDQIKKGYRVFANKVQTPEMSDYTVDHSVFIYFFDKNRQLRNIFKTNVSEDEIYKEISKSL